jgi:hypothetical protein
MTTGTDTPMNDMTVAQSTSAMPAPIYDARRLISCRKVGLLHRDLLTDGSCMIAAMIASIFCAGATSVIIAMVSGLVVHEMGYETRALDTLLWFWALGSLALQLPMARSVQHEELQEHVKAARTRVLDFSKRFKDGERASYVLLCRLMADPFVIDGDAQRPLLLRLDTAMLALEHTLREIGAHEPSIEKANAMAEATILRILGQHREQMDATQASNDALERLEHALNDAVDAPIGGTTPMMPTAPTARIARIVETAEKALISHPDLVDGQGARVDDLVRTHVPRLLRKHAEAARTASTRDVGEVDTALDRGVDAVRASVEEAIASLHDLAMDELVTELRFLTLRRGATPLLTSV